MDYKSAGVDVEAGDALVDWLRQSAPQHAPHADQVVSGIGGFASLFRFQYPQMTQPLIVSATDGVGTKVKLASEFQSFRGVGQDLVAMCVNDLICCGAQPLFFLDYYATGQLVLNQAQEFLGGVRQACTDSDCLLIGGETAEMPGVYAQGDFDCAGFAVGVVDEPKLLGSHRVHVGDSVLGVSSSGFHSNGYSLLRQVFAADLAEWRDVLLTPTHLYVKLAEHLKQLPQLKALAHITGGGMENIPRVMPQKTQLRLKSWPWPAPFTEVRNRTGMSESKMLQTLNCGIGLAVIVASEARKSAQTVIEKDGFQVFDLGTIEESGASEPQIVYGEA